MAQPHSGILAALSSGIVDMASSSPQTARIEVKHSRLFIRFGGLREGASERRLGAQLAARTGVPLRPLPVAAAKAWRLRIRSICRGRSIAHAATFLVAVTATRGDEQTTMLVPLRVVP